MMKRSKKNPIFMFGAFVFAIGLAGCSVIGGSTAVPEGQIAEDTPVPTEVTSTFLPTDTPAPTAVPEVEDAGVLGPEAYYVEEFDGDIDLYSYFLVKGNDRGTDMLFLDDGELVFNLEERQTFLYLTYDAFEYSDVRIGIRAENRAKNSQNINLICRYSAEDGWIEFSMGGDGLYEIWAFTVFDNKGYQLMASGGSTAINLGRDFNEYVAECVGNEVALFINGEEVTRVPINKDFRFLREGLVGFGVSSFDSLPVKVLVDWFGIEQP